MYNICIVFYYATATYLDDNVFFNVKLQSDSKIYILLILASGINNSFIKKQKCFYEWLL